MPGHGACPDCGGRFRKLGEDVAKMLEYVSAPASSRCPYEQVLFVGWNVLRQVRPKLSCDDCDRIVQALAPSRPIVTVP